MINTLKKILTDSGAIVMPAFPISKQLELEEIDKKRELVTNLRILDPDSDERTGKGIIADTFKKDLDIIVRNGLHG